MSKLKTKNQNTLYYILYTIPFILAFLERTVFDLGPNVELLTSAMILSAFTLNRKWTFALTFLVIALSDRVIGNSKILLFTWSGFLIPAFFSSSVVKTLYSKFDIQHSRKIFTGAFLTTLGISVNILFYLWTNFGVWLLDSFGMYTKDLKGLILCYINGLPFLKNEVFSSLLFIPIGYFVIEAVTKILRNLNLNKNSRFQESS